MGSHQTIQVNEMNAYPMEPYPTEDLQEYEKRLKQRYDEYVEFIAFVKELACEYANNIEGADVYIDSVSFEDDKVNVIAYLLNSCGDCESYSQPREFSFPIKYIWDTNWVFKEQEKRIRDNLAALKKRAMDDEQKKEKEKKERMKQYEQLKKEFEEDMS